MHNTNLPNLPPLPPPGAYSPQVCEVVRLYLAVIRDLPPQVVEAVYAHVRICVGCTQEWHLLSHSTSLVGKLGVSAPSPRVDRAVSEAAHKVYSSRRVITKVGPHLPFRATANGQPTHQLSSRRRASIGIIGALAAAAVLILALFPMLHFLAPSTGGSNQAFALPPNLSWSGYVLFHSKLEMGSNGTPYRVETYHDLGTGRIHVETMMDGKLDVVAVGDTTSMLGMDMLHHVAQWGANAWGAEDSSFTLAILRSDMQAQRAIYLGKSSFQDQAVYRIRCSNGHILLLGMDYMPMNMLQSTSGTGSEQPMYDMFKLLPAAQVSESMWNMNVPPGFKMGTLPPKP